MRLQIDDALPGYAYIYITPWTSSVCWNDDSMKCVFFWIEFRVDIGIDVNSIDDGKMDDKVLMTGLILSPAWYFSWLRLDTSPILL